MINQKKTANAIGGKTARACDSCLKKRATWFCAADDAFLCGGCDSLVHSANELASRHKRVCLDSNPPPPPSWHQGFTKKARTPRNKAKQAVRSSDNYSSQMPVVPEVGYEDELDDQDYGLLVDNIESDQMVFSVPNLDDHDHDHDHHHHHHHHADDHKGVSFKGGYEEEEDNISIAESEFNISLIGFDGVNKEWDINNYLPVVGFPDNVELAEFAADVESLLEQDGEDKEKDNNVCYYPGVKLEQEEGGEIISTTINNNDHCCYFDWSMDVENEMFNFDLNNNHSNNDCCGLYDQYSQVSGVEVDDKVVVPKVEEDELNYAPSNKQANNNNNNDNNYNNKERRILLRLNYEEVSNAWAASQGCSSPWITGRRPEFDPHHYDWPNSMDKFWPTNTGADRRGEEGTGGVRRGQVNDGDGGRSARVLRYREKRRTRLFSKKIRYQVRKLNAEKRPRLKGRFVKRTSLSPSTAIGVNVNVNVNVGSVESSFPYLHG